MENKDELMDRETNEVRVTDRRRIYLDEEGAERVNREVEQPNLKPITSKNSSRVQGC